MPSAVAPNPRAGADAPDDLDRFFDNYDEAVDDFLKDLPLVKSATNSNAAPQETSKNIDEEITVKKKRKPVPKLDENRLLSEQGIPRLRKITKRLKFRGKGHEFSDISRLLNTYQLWLDDLYPRAKFKDGLAMVEKVGHSKRMQVTRRTWLDATKPHQRDASPERISDVQMSGALPTGSRDDQAGAGGHEGDYAMFSGPTAQERTETSGRDDQSQEVPEDDELDALLADNDSSPRSAARMENQLKSRGPFDEDEDDDFDDLDALLSEQPAVQSGRSNPSPRNDANKPASNGPFAEEDFADEEEAMASMGDMW